ncbi:hypothetical protein FKP32DRAFT_1597038 [Trametes sanguinea]|nr:hypothetical protein FKP32DRAFT_1597038 [Trametes sanguinea]
MDLYPLNRIGYIISWEGYRRHLKKGYGYPHLHPPPPDNSDETLLPMDFDPQRGSLT